jgi:hypothetical protein
LWRREKRTPEQTAQLRQHFLTVTPLLAAQQAEIAQVKASMPQYTTTLVMSERGEAAGDAVASSGEVSSAQGPGPDGGVPAILPALGEDARRTADAGAVAGER